MIMLAAMLRTTYGFQYRQLSGFIAKTLGEHNTPDYTVLWRRVNQLDVKIHDGFVQVSDRKNLSQCWQICDIPIVRIRTLHVYLPGSTEDLPKTLNLWKNL